MAKAEKKKRVNLYTPQGILSYPTLVIARSQEADGKATFGCEILIPKAVWKKEGKAFNDGVMELGKEKFGKDFTLADLDHPPIVDMDKNKKAKDHEKGHIRIRAKSNADFKPGVVGAKKNPETGKFDLLSEEAVKEIKGGDIGRLVCAPYYYNWKGKEGISLGLNFVQFIQEGKALGQGRMAALEDLEEAEVEADSLEDMVDTKEKADEESDDVNDFE